MAAWPGSLPQSPLMETIEIEPEDVRAVTDPGGPQDARARALSAGDICTMSFGFDAAQYATFWSFWSTTLAAGVLAFTIAHPITKATVTAVFLDPPVVDKRLPFWIVVNVKLYLNP